MPKLYVSLIRPLLECCCRAWRKLTIKLLNDFRLYGSELSSRAVVHNVRPATSPYVARGVQIEK